ncbi:zf-PARP-domain-containing protein [Ramaria rubella]|nr:zf-PARP-domain-containing protein [Ramaria rubella]
MSDDDNKKSGGYRLEYASSGGARCDGPSRRRYLTSDCSGTAIPKGALRLGTQVDFRGNTTFVWRHWGCVTESIIANFKKSFDNADELDGFEELKAVDKERVRTAWTEGKVADEDIPESAKKGSGGEEEEEPKPKKKRAPPKKKAKVYSSTVLTLCLADMILSRRTKMMTMMTTTRSPRKRPRKLLRRKLPRRRRLQRRRFIMCISTFPSF